MGTEIIGQGDTREFLFNQEKKEEILGLLERGTFRICLREEAGTNPKILPFRYDLAIKHSQNDEPPRLKARFVLGGRHDDARYHLVHDARTVRPESVRLLIALITIFGSFALLLTGAKDMSRASQSLCDLLLN